jgi:hypothetical protein
LARSVAKSTPTTVHKLGLAARATTPTGRIGLGLADGNALPCFQGFEELLRSQGNVPKFTEEISQALVNQMAADIRLGVSRPGRKYLVAQDQSAGAWFPSHPTDSNLDSVLALERLRSEGASGLTLHREGFALRLQDRAPAARVLSHEEAAEALTRVGRSSGERMFIDPALAELPTDGHTIDGLISAERQGLLEIARGDARAIPSKVSSLVSTNEQQALPLIELPQAPSFNTTVHSVLLVKRTAKAAKPSRDCRPLDDPAQRQSCMLSAS